MPLIDEKYNNLGLGDEFLTDPLLMALAWKKSHEYIRTANWYADNFELDVSAIDLPNRCSEWVQDIRGCLKFKELELVPAPKTKDWEFKRPDDPLQLAEYKLIWQPKNNGDESIGLRPLAHMGIREQSIMTLVMMCMANDVESRQGDPSTGYNEVHEKGVVSYGNRLYCHYKDGQAEHSYGSATTYSKYYADYRKFLERPYHFARKERDEKADEEEVYLIELDISKFFDRVNRDLLIKKVEGFSSRGLMSYGRGGAVLTNVLNAFRRWEWSDTAKELFKETCSSKGIADAPQGLPQGLVASGFLANIYMADFDDDISCLIGSAIDENGYVRLCDYCRYVDDMRFVIVGPSREKIDGLGVDKLKNGDTGSGGYLNVIKDLVIESLISKLSALNLKVNSEKTKIELFRGKSVGISRTLEDIQSNVSGPVSYEDAEIHLGQLESLLVLSSGSDVEQVGGSGRFNRLASIEKDMFDVREDTLKRFAANKISKLLSNIRHLTSRDTDSNGQPLAGDWDYLQERLARRFIACWSRDPSLVHMLKKGLELFPSTRILEPVLDQLDYLIDPSIRIFVGQSDDQDAKKAAVGRYCLSEVFRHSAAVIHRKDREAIPAHADIDAYFELLQSHAIKFSEHKNRANDEPENRRLDDGERSIAKFNFLEAQARFLLLVRLDTTLESSSGCWFQDLIFKLAAGFRNIDVQDKVASRDIAVGVLVARQLVDKPKPLLRAFSALLKERDDCAEILELVAIQDPDLFRSLILHARPLRYMWLEDPKVNELIGKLYIGIRPSAKPLADISAPLALCRLIMRRDNPFGNEIMALRLMQALLGEAASFSAAEPDDVIDLAKTTVDFRAFHSPPKFEAFSENMVVKPHFRQSLGAVAAHLQSEHGESFILQRIALCVRSALAGSCDPTGFGQSFTSRVGYRGIKTTQFKRQIGLLTTPESLAGEAAQFTGWLTTLLSKLLKWPGIRVNDQGYVWPVELTISSVGKLIDDRLARLRDCYCKQSGMPGLPELVSPSWSEAKRELIVTMVQSRLPQKEDFVMHGLFLDDRDYRVRHRRHLARVAKLVTKHVEAQHIKPPANGEREQDIDLVVLPELSVHPDDMDILVHLSRKTHAIVVAGLGFISQPGVIGPNNCAVWVVPRKHNGNQNEVIRFQGKYHMTDPEKVMKIQPWRPYQLMVELAHPAFPAAPGFMLTSAVCFDSTDIALSADLRDKSHALLIPALNRDVNTFDSMVEALHYHMYQHVVLVNTGEFGGSYAMAPYEERHKRLIAHSSGNDQVAINTFKMNMFDFRRDGIGSSMKSGVKPKQAPAGVSTQ